jgi:pantetheine-phosphate adenylyltransferase
VSAVSTVLYPGSFDPLHNGHLGVIEQAARLFDEVIVAAMVNPGKANALLGPDERRTLIEASVEHLPNVRVVTRDGLVIDVARELGVTLVVKGLRTVADFEIEMQMAHTNRTVGGVDTVFLPCDPAHGYVSSTFIREIARAGGDVSALVPDPIARRLKDMSPR